MATTSTTKLQLVKPTPGTGELYNQSVENSNYDKIDAAAGAFVTTSTARAAMTAYQGQIAFETNTGKTYLCTSAPSTWVEIVMVGVSINGATAGTAVYTSRVVGDANSRYQVTVSGGMNWGSGSAAPDVNLYRDNVDILRSDDAIRAARFIPDGGTGAFVSEGQRTSNTGTFSTTDTIVQSHTFAAVNGTRYQVIYQIAAQSSSANDVIDITTRWVNGNTASTSDTAMFKANPTLFAAGRGQYFNITSYFVANATGNVTVSVSFFRSTGSGTVFSPGSATQINSISVMRA